MKVLALISSDPKLQQVCSYIEKRERNIHERIHFFRKQAEEAVKEDKQAITGYWKELTAQLIESGRLPKDYKEDDHSLSFSLKEDAVKMDDKKENSLGQLISVLTGRDG